MGTHPIFESDFDCLTEMMEGGVGIKLGMISPELLKDYLEVWWTILSCAIALVLYVVTYQYVRRHNKIHEFLTLIWPVYSAIIFICYYLFPIPMGCLRQITTWPQDRKCNYFNFSCLYSYVHNYCHTCCRLSNIPIPFWKDSRLWRFRDGYWCRCLRGIKCNGLIGCKIK